MPYGQESSHWDGASLGDADALTVAAADGIGYRAGNQDYRSPWMDVMMRALLNGTGNRGVLNNWLNELAVTGVATPVQVDTGAAILYGLWYENDAALTVAVPSPTNDTRIDRIVVRRNWAAQTCRVTRIPGTEGGGVPALTQSPAPDGTGIYDIPLAQASITTGGVITVTDEREFCQFLTRAVDGSIGTAQIVNEAVDWEARAQVPKNLFFGGPDLLAFASRFSYDLGNYDYLDGTVSAAWGAAAATMEGWRCTGTGVAQDRPFYAAFVPPADYVPGTTIEVRVWWIDDFAGAASFDWYSTWQAYLSGEDPILPGAYTYYRPDYTAVLDTVHIQSLRPITGLTGAELVLYDCMYYNAAGAEALLMVGLEFLYTGYV